MLILIAPLSFATGEGGERIEGAAEIRIRFEPHPAIAADPSPASCQDDGAEQIRHDLDLVVPALVQFRPDPGKGDPFGKQQQLHRGRTMYPNRAPTRRASDACAGGFNFGGTG